MNHAIITKVKAMYGKRLTAAEFASLSACRTVEECAAFLAEHPAYRDAFAGIDLRDIKTSRIELLLKREYCLEFDRLVCGLSGKERELTEQFIGAYKLEFITWALRYADLPPERQDPFRGIFEPLLHKYSAADPEKIQAAKNKEQVLAALDPRHRAIVEATVLNGEIDYAAAENALWKAYYADLALLLKKKQTDAGVAALVGTTVDLKNILRVFRLREYFDYPADEILPFLLRPLYRLDEETVARLCACADKREFDAVLRATPYKALSAAPDGIALEKAARSLLEKKAGTALHFAKTAPAAVYAYLLCKRYETEKIKTVIESVRYDLKEVI